MYLSNDASFNASYSENNVRNGTNNNTNAYTKAPRMHKTCIKKIDSLFLKNSLLIYANNIARPIHIVNDNGSPIVRGVSNNALI